MLTIENYPHLAEAVVACAPPDALPALRGVSRWFRALVDARLYARLRHDIGRDLTTTTILPRPLRVDLWAAPASLLSKVRVLDVALGAYRDPNVLDLDDLDDLDDLEEELEEEAWKEDTARVLPRLERLDYAVLEGNHDTVFRHVLRDRHVPTLICPVKRSAFAADWLAVPHLRVGAYVPTDRLIVPLALAPWDGVLGLHVFREKPLAVALVLRPAPLGAPPDEHAWHTARSVAEAVALHTADSGGVETPAGQPVPDVPARFTLVGFEYWDEVAPRAGGTWEEKIRADVEAMVRERARPADVAAQLDRLSFRTLRQWRDEDVTTEEWELVSGVDLD